MVTMQIVEGSLVTKFEDRVVDDYGCILKELTSWLNNGYKLLSIKDGIYEVDIDEEQLCRVEFEDNENNIYFKQVMTIANAEKFKSYYGAALNLTKKDNTEIEVDFKAENCRIIDLRGQSSEYINLLKADDSQNIDLEEAIDDDLSYM